MANKYYGDQVLSSSTMFPPSKTLPTPPPGTKGVKDAAPRFAPVSEEPKKGM
jgi:hypothetical protein